MLAAVAMAMSSVTVVGNSILLGKYRPSLPLTKSKIQDFQNKGTKKTTNKDIISKTSLG
jgi:hypothetical protein